VTFFPGGITCGSTVPQLHEHTMVTLTAARPAARRSRLERRRCSGTGGPRDHECGRCVTREPHCAGQQFNLTVNRRDGSGR
jgi:hypothetical protein